jgi:protein-L-isoaspartate(D-aspartate) O-methyltransferase
MQSAMEQQDLAHQLNRIMVDLLLQADHILTSAVESAFRNTLRHTLLPPDVSLGEIYQDKTIILKQAVADGPLPSGRTLSSSTMPSLLARILEASELKPGMRVLQIGTGPGYLVALISHIVAETGTVVTVEIDSQIATVARENLSRLPCRNIYTVCADGYLGYPAMEPYDRIVATASCADMPLPWIGQLNETGLIVLPFSFSQRASLYPMLVFRKAADGLIGKVASSLMAVGFIPLYGDNAEYPVLYQQTISRIESAVALEIQQLHIQKADYKAISLTGMLEIATVIASSSDPIEAIDAKLMFARSLDKWNLLGKPTIEDFVFHLVPRGQSVKDYTWRFPKKHHDLYVTAHLSG